MKMLREHLKSFFSVFFMVVALFLFSNCSNTGKGIQEDYNENTEEIEEEAEETGEEIEDAAEEAGDEIEEETDDFAD